MSQIKINPRRFLLMAGGALGTTALAGAGLAMTGTYRQPELSFVESTYGEARTMNDRILVAYASQTGSTAGVAEAIGKTLAESGAQVDVRRMKDVVDLAPYRAVVAGSAIHGSRWLPEAMQFVQDHRTELARVPFAAFLVCMTLAMPRAEQYRGHVGSWLEPVRTLVKPVSEGLFAGALDINRISSFGDRLKFRLSVAMGVWAAGDHRDWNAIRTWAAGLAPVLH